MTTPWKTWTREREPSMTLTWTLMVSPARKSGMSSRRLTWSMSSSLCMIASLSRRCHRSPTGQCRWKVRPAICRCYSPCGRGTTGAGRDESVCHSRGPRPKSGKHLREHLAVARVQARRVEAVDHVGPAQGRAPQPLVASPPGDPAVVAREQHLRDAAPTPERGLGEDRVLQQAVLVRLLDQRAGVAENSGDEPRHGLDHGQHGHLSPVEHVVAEGDDADRHPLPRLVVHPLVDALVPAAGEREPGLRRELACHRLGERRAAGAGDDQVRYAARSGRVRPLVHDGVQCLAPRLRAHDHALASSVRRVVDGAVAVVGEVAQVVHPQVDQALLTGLADQREAERLKVVREDGEDVEPQRACAHDSSRSNSPAGGSMTTRPPATSTSGTRAATNGTSPSRPSARRMTSRSWVGRASSPTTFPTGSPATVTTLSPTRSFSYQASSSSTASSLSTSRRTPRRPSAAVRSRAEANPSSRVPLWSRTVASCSGPAAGGSVENRAPATNRSCGASVRTSMVTSPRRPWALPIRATTTSMPGAFPGMGWGEDEQQGVCQDRRPGTPLAVWLCCGDRGG